MPRREAFKKYIRVSVAELRPYVPGENMRGISVNDEDITNGSPKPGDMIARNPKKLADQWLVAKAYFEENYKRL